MLHSYHLLKSFDLGNRNLISLTGTFTGHFVDVACDANLDSARVRVVCLGGVFHAHNLLALEAFNGSLGLFVASAALS
jgi:hypothetical protein